MHCRVLALAFVLCSCLALVKAAQLKKWCSSLPGLNAAQINMCRNTRLMYPAIRSGLENAVKICEGEFRNERWNCAMLGSHNLLKRAPEGTKEAAFATALTAASLVLQISTACEPDKRLGSAACPCKLDGPAHTAQWRHCRSKLAHTAVRFTTSFLSLTYDKSDSLSLMNAHNIRTGLKVFKHFDPAQCRSLKDPKDTRCSSTPLKLISAKLKEKYARAYRFVSPSNLISQLKQKKVKKNVLVYMKQSPDYCTHDRLAGIAGTQDRTCDARLPSQEGGCAVLCCGRDFYVYNSTKSRPCKCAFRKCADCKSHEKFRLVCKRCQVPIVEAKCN